MTDSYRMRSGLCPILPVGSVKRLRTNKVGQKSADDRHKTNRSLHLGINKQRIGRWNEAVGRLVARKRFRGH